MQARNFKNNNKAGKNRARRKKNGRPQGRGPQLRRRGRALPAAITTNVPKRFNTIRTSGTATTVSGCDLVYSIPDSLSAVYQNSQVIAMIPSNPSYWTGTRISAVAAGYQNYRPIKFEVVYVPQCAVTQQGNVLAGTLWDIAPSDTNLQQTLKTSNGGMLTQCYQTATSIVRMKSNLQFNLYRMGGEINQESNPFTFWALAIGCYNSQTQRIIPGYFYIRYEYQFKNPIGTGVEYQNSQITTIQSKSSYLLNAVLYVCQSFRTENGLSVPVGSRIDIEFNNSSSNPAYTYNYNGTPVTIGLQLPVWILENQPNSVTTNLLKADEPEVPITYSSIEIVGNTGNVNIDPNEAISFVKDDKVVTWVNNTTQAVGYYLQQGTEYYRTLTSGNDFGVMLENTQYRQVFQRLLEFTRFVQQITRNIKANAKPKNRSKSIPCRHPTIVECVEEDKVE